ncbi:hypothetical protein ACOSP7_004413 [Xanthoceras sorbifolium]
MSSSYHLQIEVANLTLEHYLHCFAGEQPRKWMDWLSWAEFSYNTSLHSATKMTPFEIVYGVPPPGLLPYVPRTTRVIKELRHHLTLAQERMKKQVDHFVYLKLHLYKQTSVAFRSSMKLSPRYFGPFEILKKIGQVAYRLALPPGTQIHDMVVRIMLNNESSILPIPKTILDRHMIQKGKYRPRTEVLVKWAGASMEDVTWETLWRFSQTYPEFILADKDTLRREE